ncbi:alpha/beta hydrolase [Streptomyces sp. NPDC048717]|uniref:alpha/beta fold hydrolase n=1 Tax=Streptomyces sp. NPDC048717 TaxID=3154928 RepID=UPI00344ACE4E
MSRPDGTAVVLLHALALDSGMWRECAAALTARGRRVLPFDQRGFGGTPLGEEPPSLDTVADDVVRTLDREGIDRAVLAGCSMGGYVALAVLRRHPHRVSALALFNTRAAADSPETAAGRLAFAERIVRADLRESLIAATTPLLVGATTRATRPGLVASLLDTVRGADPAAVAWAQRAIAARPDERPAAPVGVPAVVVAGSEDGLVGLAESWETAAALGAGDPVVVADAGHLLPLERPEAAAELIAALIDRVDGAVPAPGPDTAGAHQMYEDITETGRTASRGRSEEGARSC